MFRPEKDFFRSKIQTKIHTIFALPICRGSKAVNILANVGDRILLD